LRMRNAGQSEVASRSASVFKYVLDVCGHGGDALCRYLPGPGGGYRLLEVPIYEYAMRGSPRSHPALLVSSSTNGTYAVTAEMPFVCISEAPGMDIAYWRSQFSNTQCEAVLGRIRQC